MDRLIALYAFIFDLVVELESGLAFSASIKRVSSYRNCKFSSFVRRIQIEFKESKRSVIAELKCSKEERACLNIICVGLEEGFVLSSLKSMLETLEHKIKQEVQNRVKKLPVKSLLPIFLFQWPALLFLIVWPLIQTLIKEMSL